MEKGFIKKIAWALESLPVSIGYIFLVTIFFFLIY